jgi:hypothetical protein
MIKQSNCRHKLAWAVSSSAHALFHGGSSFDILWQSKESITACSTIDHFDDTYSIYCPIRTTSNIIEGKQGIECGNITATLTFEHYDAFDNKGKALSWQYTCTIRMIMLLVAGIRDSSLINEEILSRFVCPKILPHNIKSQQSLTSYPILFSSEMMIPSHHQPSLYKYSENLWVTTADSLASPLAVVDYSFKYVWSSRNIISIS